MAKPIKNILNSNEFLLGFEVEFIWNADKIDQEDLEDLFYRIHRDIICDEDGSIEPDYNDDNDECTMELQTPPLPPAQAFDVLNKVFAIVNKYGYTNDSCGFHLNFSPKSTKLFNSIDPFKFTKLSLWKTIKKEFGREHNEYCMDVWADNPNPSKLELFKGLIDEDSLYLNRGKDADVNFDNYFTPKDDESRVEIRAFGGVNYHKKFKAIKKYARQILNNYVKCCEC
jgi:hypothetical protein